MVPCAMVPSVAALWFLIAMVVVYVSQCEGVAVDTNHESQKTLFSSLLDDDQPCMHDDVAVRASTPARSFDVVVPQVYHHAAAAAAALSSSRHSSSQRRHLGVLNNDAMPPSLGRIRFSVSSLDVYDVSRTCQYVGHHIMDFLGGTVTCSDEQDLIDNGKIDSLLSHALPEALKRLADAIQVYQVVTPLTLYGGLCPFFSYNASQLVNGITGTDLILFVAAAKTRGNTIAWSSYCGTDQNNRPITGRLNVGSQWLPSNWSALDITSRERLIRVLMHEVVHILGVNIDFMSIYFPRGSISSVTQLRGKSFAVSVFTGANAVHAVRVLTGCDSITYVELEDEGGAGTALSHVERRSYFQDLMVGVSGTTDSSNRLSALTLGILADSGFYTVDVSQAETTVVWGANAGCAFLNDPCLNRTTSSLADASQAFFCSPVRPELTQIVANLMSQVAVDPAALIRRLVMREMQSHTASQPNRTRSSTTVSATIPNADEEVPFDSDTEDSETWLQLLSSMPSPMQQQDSSSPSSQCTFDHYSVGTCRLYNATAPLSPSVFQYFPTNASLGGNMSLVDHCPIVIPRSPLLGGLCRVMADSLGTPQGVVNNSDGTSAGFRRAYRGYDGRCINTMTLTLKMEEPTKTTTTNSRGVNWVWTHEAVCVRMRCVQHQRGGTAPAFYSIQWSTPPSADDESELQWSNCSHSSSPNPLWVPLTTVASQQQQQQQQDYDNSAVNDDGQYLSPVVASWTFAECPLPSVVCIGDLKESAVIWEDSVVTTPTLIQTSSTAATPLSTGVPPLTTSLPAVTTPTIPVVVPDTTTTAAVVVPPQSTVTTTSPPLPPPYLPTAPPPLTTSSLPQVMPNFTFTCSGTRWSQILVSTTNSNAVRNATRALLSAALGVSVGDIIVSDLRPGSLIVTFNMAAASSAALISQETVESSIRQNVDVTGVANYYQHTLGTTEAVVFMSIAATSKNTTAATTQTPTTNTNTTAATDAIGFCVQSPWCLGLSIGAILALVVTVVFCSVRWWLHRSEVEETDTQEMNTNINSNSNQKRISNKKSISSYPASPDSVLCSPAGITPSHNGRRSFRSVV